MMTDQFVGKIPLRNRKGEVRAYAIVDAEDFVWASQYRWYAINGKYAARHYFDEQRNHTVFLLHREILGLLPTKEDSRVGDHINRDPLDDRRCNLRIVPGVVANFQNRSSYHNSSSQYRGVSWNKQSQKWVAYTHSNGRRVYLGIFANEVEAALVAERARQQFLPYAVEQTTALITTAGERGP